jgi:DNA polymerase III sliding clamp (beta) subunit (PCNA family)
MTSITNSKTLLQAFKALLTIVPTNDVRYYLNGIKLEAVGDELSLTATDGSRLAIIKMSSAFEFTKNCNDNVSVILDRNSVKAFISGATSKTSLRIFISVGGDVYGYRDGTTETKFSVIKGRYPDVARLIPKDNRTPEIDDGIGLNGDYLKDVGTFVKCFHEERALPMTKLEFGGATDSVVVKMKHTDDIAKITYVLQPMRLGVEL